MQYLRGDIYFIERGYASGSEQQSGRPAIIISNNKCNTASEVVEIVYMTTQPKTDLPTHVTIHSTGKRSTALCEQITSVYKDRIGNFLGTVTDEEMKQIEIALTISLSLPDAMQPKVTEISNEPAPAISTEEQEKLIAMNRELIETNENLKMLYEATREQVETAESSLKSMRQEALYAKAQLDLLLKLYQEQVEKNTQMANTRISV